MNEGTKGTPIAGQILIRWLRSSIRSHALGVNRVRPRSSFSYALAIYIFCDFILPRARARRRVHPRARVVRVPARQAADRDDEGREALRVIRSSVNLKYDENSHNLALTGSPHFAGFP